MNISSVVLRSNPRKLAQVRLALAELPGVEIHADGGNGRFVLTIEDLPTETPESTFVKLQQIDGVVNASLVYQYCDNASEEELER
jgi:periplasmic nitrate reductase NapD